MVKITKIILALTSIILIAASCNSKNPAASYSVPLQIGNEKIFVDVANTSQKQRQGLSGREKLQDDQGMLFDFSSQGGITPGFWMKNMKFDLDLIWIEKNHFSTSLKYTIIGITANVPAPKNPGDKLPMYYPPAPVDMVLEVNAGWSRENEIEVGDEIQF